MAVSAAEGLAFSTGASGKVASIDPSLPQKSWKAPPLICRCCRSAGALLRPGRAIATRSMTTTLRARARARLEHVHAVPLEERVRLRARHSHG